MSRVARDPCLHMRNFCGQTCSHLGISGQDYAVFFRQINDGRDSGGSEKRREKWNMKREMGRKKKGGSS